MLNYIEKIFSELRTKSKRNSYSLLTDHIEQSTAKSARNTTAKSARNTTAKSARNRLFLNFLLFKYREG